MSTKHAPGPWRFTKMGKQHLLVNANGGRISYTDDDMSEANARLIADAPNLLAERDRLKAVNEELSDLVARIQGALGTGETGDALVAVARDAARAEMELAARIRKEEEQ